MFVDARKMVSLGGLVLGVMFCATPVHAATYRAFADVLYAKPGESVVIHVEASSPEIPVNAFSAKFRVDGGEVVASAPRPEVLDYWLLAPVYRSSEHEFAFEGLSVKKGFAGLSGPVADFTITRASAGIVRISFIEGSILADDGKATDVLRSMEGTEVIFATSPTLLPASPQNTPLPTLPQATTRTTQTTEQAAESLQAPSDTCKTPTAEVCPSPLEQKTRYHLKRVRVIPWWVLALIPGNILGIGFMWNWGKGKKARGQARHTKTKKKE